MQMRAAHEFILTTFKCLGMMRYAHTAHSFRSSGARINTQNKRNGHALIPLNYSELLLIAPTREYNPRLLMVYPRDPGMCLLE